MVAHKGITLLITANKGFRVTGIDSDHRAIEQAKFVKEHLYNDLDVHFEVSDAQKYVNKPSDLVICSGLLYHLTDILGACEAIYRNCVQGAVISSCVIEHEGKYVHVHDHKNVEAKPFNCDY